MQISDKLYGELIGLLTGLVLIVVGRSLAKKYNRLRNGGSKAKGIVFQVNRETYYTSDSNMVRHIYNPVIRFVTNESQEWITKEYNIGGQLGAYTEGQEVKIIYNLANPEDFIIDDVRSRIVGPTLTLIGLAMFISCLVLAVMELMAK